ncbi:hypothetical protein [Vallicoccus soli]|uniref:Uncharacterized protein n=1 Tax=Vallicoccus soli TaxID=2339232 RepID=A0A3A3YYU0_9ACTN|nr:hypothetical protein [Vallicoccus soli]RJK94308.1 hypothetical protein D5H78_15125 [Vallicoccus soli]
MAELVVDGQRVVLRLSGWERFSALRRGDVVVPRTAVGSVRVVEDVLAEVRGLRAPGLEVPRVVRVGTWRRRGAPPDFVVARRGEPGLVVELSGERWGRLVVGTPDAVTARELALRLLGQQPR